MLVPFPEKAQKILEKLNERNGKVIELSKGAARHGFDKARKKAGLETLRFHDLRHIAISRMWSSRRNALGLWCSRILAISKNKVPWILQSKPCDLPSEFFLLTPARLKGWHGNPASKTSCLGIDFVSTSLISPANK